jgi:Domain of unknown function (DUF4166)
MEPLSAAGEAILQSAHMSEALFPSRLGAAFAQLDPKLQWVHNGDSRNLRGTVTVERGSSVVAKLLSVLTALPPALENAPIRVQIEIEGHDERWIRTYAGTHRMSSTLLKRGDAMQERVGPAALTFRLVARDAGMDWQLRRVSMFGVPLPAKWFEISARVDVQSGRYHFLIDSAVRGVGRIVRYEGLLDVGT